MGKRERRKRRANFDVWTRNRNRVNDTEWKTRRRILKIGGRFLVWDARVPYEIIADEVRQNVAFPPDSRSSVDDVQFRTIG